MTINLFIIDGMNINSETVYKEDEIPHSFIVYNDKRDKSRLAGTWNIKKYEMTFQLLKNLISLGLDNGR